VDRGCFFAIDLQHQIDSCDTVFANPSRGRLCHFDEIFLYTHCVADIVLFYDLTIDLQKEHCVAIRR